MKKFIVFLLTILIISPIYATQNKVSEYSLPNGLKLIVKEDHRTPVALFQIWYKVGSGYEPNGITGISHVLEHMMFRGTKKYGPGKLKEIIVENGGEINAMTNDDYTSYYEILFSNKLPIAFELESDRMKGLLINEKDFKKEVQVVIEERRMRTEDNPQAQTFERFLATAYISSPYHSPTIGWISDIENLNVKDLYKWYNTWYSPNNAIITVVGDVQPKNIYKLTRKYFGNIQTSNIPKSKPKIEQKPLGTRTVTVNLPAKLPFLIMGYNVPSLKTAEKKEDAYTLEVIAAILDIGKSSRISTKLIRKQQIAVDAFAGYSLYQKFDSLFLLGGIPTPKHDIEKLKKALLDQIKNLQTKLVTQNELNRIKAQIITSKIYAKDSIQIQAYEIGSLESIDISWEEGEKHLQYIQKITPKQIQHVAKKYLVPNRLTIGILNPIGEKDNA